MRLHRLFLVAMLALIGAGASLRAQMPADGPNDGHDDHPLLGPPQIDFECVGYDSTATRLFKVINPNRRDTLVIRGFKVSPGFKVRTRPMTRIAPGDSLVDTVFFHPLAPNVNYRGRLEMDHDGPGGPGVIDLMGTGSVPPKVQMFVDGGLDTTMYFRLGRMVVGDTSILHCITLYNPSCRQAMIAEIRTGGHPQIIFDQVPTAPMIIPPHDSIHVCVRFAPSAPVGLQADTLTLVFSGGLVQRVVFGGLALLRAEVAASPSRLIFAGQNIGDQGPPDTAWLYNTGISETVVYSLALEGPDAADFAMTAEFALPHPLKAGARDSMRVFLHFAPLSGGKHVTQLRVVHGTPGSDPTYPLLIEGVANIAAHRVSPRNIIFGRVQIGDTAVLPLVVANTGPVDITLPVPQLLDPDAGRFRIDPVGITSLPPGDSVVYKVRFIPDSARVFNRARINLAFTDGGGPVNVPLVGEGIRPSRREVVVTPNPVIFNCVPRGDTARINIDVRNASAEDIAIRGVFMKNQRGELPFITPTIAVPIVIHPGGSATLKLLFSPGGIPVYSDQLRIEFASDGNVEVPVTGNAVDVPNLASNVAEVAFAPVGVDSTTEDTLGVSNPSDCLTLRVDSVVIGDPAFHLLSGVTVGESWLPQQATRLRMAFTPRDTIEHRSDLRVYTSFGNFHGRLTVSLVGRARRKDTGGGGKPRVDIDPVAFDSITIGAFAVQRFTLVNTGTSNDTIDIAALALAQDSTGEFVAAVVGTDSVLAAAGASSIAIDVTFTPRTSGTRIASLAIPHRSGPAKTAYTADIKGYGRKLALRVQAALGGTEADLGDVPLGDSVTVTAAFAIANEDSTVATVLDTITADGAASGQITIDGPAHAALPALGSLSYTARFRPKRLGGDTLHLTAACANGARLPLTIVARGVARAARRIWLDSALAQVGDPFELALLCSPPLMGTEGITSYRARLIVSPTALYVAGISAQGAAVPVRFMKPDTIDVAWNATSAPAVGDTLARLKLRGLVTGRPSNDIRIAFAEINGLPITDLRSGLVELTGCDVGTGPLGKPIAARRVYPSPAGQSITVTYLAPRDSHPTMEFIDATGMLVRRDQLPDGTGVETEVTTNIAELGSGIYFLQLRSGTMRSVVTLVVEK